MRRAALPHSHLRFSSFRPRRAIGLSIGYTVTAGTAGDNGWYRSPVTVRSPSGRDRHDLPAGVKTFHTSSDALDCTATDGQRDDPLPPAVQDRHRRADRSTASMPSRAADCERLVQPARHVLVHRARTRRRASLRAPPARTVAPTRSRVRLGTCRDNAGNVSAAGVALKYDATPPTVGRRPRARPTTAAVGTTIRSPLRSRAPIRHRGSTRAPAVTYTGPDTGGTSLAGLVRRSRRKPLDRVARAQIRRDGHRRRPRRSHGQPDERTAGTRSRSRSRSAEPTRYRGWRLHSGRDIRRSRQRPASVEGACRDNAGNTATGQRPAQVRRNGAQASERQDRPRRRRRHA